MAYTADQVIARYIELRDEAEAISERQKLERKPVDDAMLAIEAWLTAKMNEVGTDNLKGPSGTAYKSVTARAKVVDWDQILRFVQDNHAWEMLVRNVAGKEVQQYAAEHGGALPPGVEISQIARVSVRRS